MIRQIEVAITDRWFAATIRLGNGIMIREVAAEEYNGPDFAVIRALGEYEWEVTSKKTGKRIGIYPSRDAAGKIAQNFDKLALKEYLKEQRKKKKKEQSGAWSTVKISRKTVDAINKKLQPVLRRHFDQWELCGSYRRGKKVVGDIDYVVLGGNLSKFLQELDQTFTVLQIPQEGERILTVVVKIGKLDVQLQFNKAKDKNAWGAAMLHSTGSGMFNVGLRALAQKKGFKLNQFGLFKGNVRFAGKTEEEIFRWLNRKLIPPEEREEFWKVQNRYRIKD